MKKIEVSSYEQLSKEAALIVKEAMKSKPDLVLGLATGGTPVGLYKELIQANEKGEVSFSELVTFNLDEYVGLPQSHSQSYYTFMQENLFNHVDMNKERIHIPNGEASNLEEECIRYEAALKEHGPVDLQILGIGTNGHIAFNEPGTSFQSRTHVVELDESTRQANARFFNHIDEVPKLAITMGIETIMESKKILLLAHGESKRQAMERLFSGEVNEDFPASILNNHPDVTVIFG